MLQHTWKYLETSKFWVFIKCSIWPNKDGPAIYVQTAIKGHIWKGSLVLKGNLKMKKQRNVWFLIEELWTQRQIISSVTPWTFEDLIIMFTFNLKYLVHWSAEIDRIRNEHLVQGPSECKWTRANQQHIKPKIYRARGPYMMQQALSISGHL